MRESKERALKRRCMCIRDAKASSMVERRFVVRNMIPWKYSSSRRKTNPDISEELGRTNRMKTEEALGVGRNSSY